MRTDFQPDARRLAVSAAFAIAFACRRAVRLRLAAAAAAAVAAEGVVAAAAAAVNRARRNNKT